MTPETIYLTLDIDWAHDEITGFALDFFEKNNIPVTVFVTHDSPALKRVREMEIVETGIHPNFNDLIEGSRLYDGVSMRERVERLLALCPEARSLRSHCLLTSSRLLYLMAELGLKYELNSHIPASAGIELKPWPVYRSRVLRVPFLFEDSLADEVERGWDAGPVLGNRGLKVLNFHPVRLYLNSYEMRFPSGIQPDLGAGPLKKARRPLELPGSMSFLTGLIGKHLAAGGRFGKISEIGQPEPARAGGR